MALKFIELKDPSSIFAEQVFEIYGYSFPPEELESIDLIKTRLLQTTESTTATNDSYHILMGIDEGKAVAFSMYNYSKSYNLGFIAYLAVDKDCRGKGFGSQILQENLNHLSTIGEKNHKQKPLALVWEVDRPSDTSIDTEAQIRKKRIQFYEKNGATLLPFIDYTTPPLEEGLPSLAYYIMHCFIDKNNEKLSLDHLVDLVDYILLEIYSVDKKSSYYQKALDSILSSQS